MKDYRIENPYEKKPKRTLIKLIIIITIILAGAVAGMVFFSDELGHVKDLVSDRLNEDKITVANVKNEYYIDEDFTYYKNMNTLHPKNKEELHNTLRTIANAGVEKFSFYCDKNYTNWLDDLVESQKYFRQLIGFNHPFNEITDVDLSYNQTTRRVELIFKRKYTNKQIEKVKKEIDRIYNELYNENLSLRENIKIFNNYIIEHTNYDQVKADGKDSGYNSDTAYGVLFEGYGLCLGYSDTMYLFLEKLGVKQFRIINDTHAWNVVHLDGQWLHLDATWNDQEYYFAQNRFFLVTTGELWNLDSTSHSFNQEIYAEATVKY